MVHPFKCAQHLKININISWRRSVPNTKTATNRKKNQTSRTRSLVNSATRAGLLWDKMRMKVMAKLAIEAICMAITRRARKIVRRKRNIKNTRRRKGEEKKSSLKS